VVKVIWHKPASPPHTDGSIVFVRLRQCSSLSNTCFLGPTRIHIPNGISIGSAIFAQLTAERLYTLQWAAPPPSNLPLSRGDVDPNLIYGFESTTQTASRSVQPFLQGLRSWQRDRQRDRPHYSVCNNRPHLRSTAMRHNWSTRKVVPVPVVCTNKSHKYTVSTKKGP